MSQSKNSERYKSLIYLIIYMDSLSAFLPFKSAIDALANANSISEGIASDELRNFIATNLPKKLKKFVLGVSDPKLGGALSEQLSGLKVILTYVKMHKDK